MGVTLALRDIEKSFPGARALKSVSMDVHPGRVHALLGENGAGKSTLIKVASGAMRPDAGQVLVDGEDVHLTPLTARRAGIRVLHQERQVALSRTVADNVLLDRVPRNRLGLVSRRAVVREATRRMARVGVDLDPDALAWTLTVAQMQLLELARAVCDQARCIIMDEPTASLHRGEVGRLFSVVKQVRAEGISVIYISHHLDEVMEVADDFTVLRDGSRVGGGELAGVTSRELVSMMFGSDVQLERSAIHEGSATPGPTVVRMRGASLGRAVHEVDLEVNQGEVLVVTGAVGSGTREVAQMLAGVLSPTAGTVDIFGASGRRRRAAAKHGVAFLPADRKRQALMLERSVVENTLLAESGMVRSWLVNPLAAARRALSACARLSVKVGDVRGPVRGLSGGNQQRVVLARWLQVDSRVLVLDEPTAGVDIPSKSEIYRLLRRLAAQGTAVVVFSTEYQEIRCIADRVVVMRDGHIVGEIAGEQATEHRLFEMEMGSAHVDD